MTESPVIDDIVFEASEEKPLDLDRGLTELPVMDEKEIRGISTRCGCLLSILPIWVCMDCSNSVC